MIVHTPSQSLLLRTRNSLAIKSLLPKFKEIDFEGHNIAVRHGLDEVRVLRNLGIAAPPPILHYYGWPGPPDKLPLWHQRETAAFLTLHPRAFCFNEQGTIGTMGSRLPDADWTGASLSGRMSTVVTQCYMDGRDLRLPDAPPRLCGVRLA